MAINAVGIGGFGGIVGIDGLMGKKNRGGQSPPRVVPENLSLSRQTLCRLLGSGSAHEAGDFCY
ncbi:hypothetical protein JHJ32_11180 [Parapedobacter sp. ISTM3]|nr:hypothetical protein [Parapedobacter sp. ISTM3]